MNKRFILLALVVFAISVLLSAGLYAASGGCPDVIEMKNEKAFEQHKQGIVQFSHKKHAEDYKVGCGDCHHDAEGKPLTDLKCEDKVQACFECHKKAGVPKVDRSLPPAERAKQELEYYYGAMHANCVDCHKKFNTENKTKKAPVGCTQCHPKAAKK